MLGRARDQIAFSFSNSQFPGQIATGATVFVPHDQGAQAAYHRDPGTVDPLSAIRGENSDIHMSGSPNGEVRKTAASVVRRELTSPFASRPIRSEMRSNGTPGRLRRGAPLALVHYVYPQGRIEGAKVWFTRDLGFFTFSSRDATTIAVSPRESLSILQAQQ